MRGAVLARASAAALLAAVAGRAAARDLVLWTTGGGEMAAVAEIASAFNATRGTSQPRVVVTQQRFDSFADRIVPVIRSGRGPDVFTYPQDRLGGWVEAGGAVEPVDRFLDARIRERFVPASLEALTYRGHVYGLPFTFKVIALYYNPELVKTPPRTTAELAVLARRLSRPAKGVYGLAYQYTNYYFHAALQNGMGGGPFDAQMRPALDRDQNVQAMRLLLRWCDDFLPRDPPTLAAVLELFNARKAAMVFEGPWFRADVAPGVPFRVAQLPALSEAGDRPMRPWMTVEGLYVSAASDLKEDAYAFAAYATDVKAARTMAVDGGQMPSNQKAYLDPLIMSDPTLTAFVMQARVALPMPNTPEMSAMWSPATTALGTIVRRDATPEAALARAQGLLLRAIASPRAAR